MRQAIGNRMAFLATFLVLIGVVVLGSTVAAQVTEHVQWDPTQPVAWHLFIGSPPADAHLQAEAAAIHMTLSWSVSYTIDYDRTRKQWYGYVDQSSIKATNTMEPSLSWVVPKGEASSVLAHEQRHFDLNEAYRRKLVCLLAQPRSTGTTADSARSALSEKINAAASQLLDKLSDMQATYDKETVHGTNHQMQASWGADIDAWLANPMQAP